MYIYFLQYSEITFGFFIFPRFPCPVLKVQFNPRIENEILVTPMRHAAIVVTLDLTASTQVTSNNATAKYKLVPLDDENDPQIVATYDTRGKHIYTGNSRGKILVFSNTKKGDDKHFKIVSQKIPKSFMYFSNFRGSLMLEF